MENGETLAKAIGRALRKIISSIYNNKNFRFNSYKKLFYFCAIPVLDFTSSFWNFKKFQSINNFQNRAIRYFQGVYRFAPTWSVYGDTEWIPSQYRLLNNFVL